MQEFIIMYNSYILAMFVSGSIYFFSIYAFTDVCVPNLVRIVHDCHTMYVTLVVQYNWVLLLINCLQTQIGFIFVKIVLLVALHEWF